MSSAASGYPCQHGRITPGYGYSPPRSRGFGRAFPPLSFPISSAQEESLRHGCNMPDNSQTIQALPPSNANSHHAEFTALNGIFGFGNGLVRLSSNELLHRHLH